MRRFASSLLLSLVLALPALAQPAGDMSLPEMLTALSKDPRAPGAVDALLAEMGRNPAAAAMLSPAQKQKLRAVIDEAIRTGKVDGLEAPLVLTVAEMGAAATVAHGANVANPSRPTATRPTGQSEGGLPGAPARVVKEPLGIPVARQAAAPTSTTPAVPGPLGHLGVEHGRTWGDETLDAHAPDSDRLAAVLNRLAMNPAARPTYIVTVGDREATTPDALIALLQAAPGHELKVEDVRTFANFADLSYQGRSVAAAVWTDTGIAVPGAGRNLAVPVTHSQHEIHVRGPVVNAHVSFFMGIDGEAKFRGMRGARPDWTGRRVAHTYTGAKAVEATRVAGEVRRAMTEKAAANPDLPWGGYYALGVCNDSNAFVEHAMTGKTTLFPLTRDLKYYQGSSEIDRIARAMPVDGRGAPADLERVLASMPEQDPDDLFFPTLREDIAALERARPGSTGQAGSTGQTAPSEGIDDRLEPTQQQAPTDPQPARVNGG